MNRHSFIEALEARIAPAGIVLATYDAVTRVLTLTGDDLDNSVEVFQTSPTTWRVEGKDDAALVKTSINVVGDERLDVGPISVLTMSMNGGNDRVELINLNTLRSLSADTGAGNDTLKTLGLTVTANASFNGGAGLDAFEFDGLHAVISGNLAIGDSGDGLTFNFGAASTVIGGSVIYVGSAAIDTLTMSTDTALRIGKQLTFIANGGNDRVQFGSQGTVSIGRDGAGRSVNYVGGSGNDRLAIGSSNVALLGSVEMSGGSGNDTLDLDGLIVSVGKSLAGVSVRLVGEQGTDQIDLQGSRLAVAGLVSFDGGADADTLDLTGVHRLFLNGGASFMGGAGADLFQIGTDVLGVVGNLSFDGGDDADVASIEGDGTIAGSVSLLLGGATAGTQTAEARSRSGLPGALIVSGAVNVDATGNAGTFDSAKLTNISVGRLLSVKLGEGTSFVDIDNIRALATAIIDTRGGDDEVQIERDATYGVSLFASRLLISLGAGTDNLLIGKGSRNNLSIFRGNVSADGGAGTNTRNDILAENTFATGVTFTGTAF
jgi:hypothetical protein